MAAQLQALQQSKKFSKRSSSFSGVDLKPFISTSSKPLKKPAPCMKQSCMIYASQEFHKGKKDSGLTDEQEARM